MKTISLALSGLILCLSACNPTGTRTSFDRKQMERLVQQVRRRPFTGDRVFFWENVAGSATIVPEKKRKWVKTADGGTREVVGPDGRPKFICARRTPTGKLTVSIMTQWGNHVDNETGFVYYDSPPVVITNPHGETELEIPGDMKRPTSNHAIDAHWREVYNGDIE